jgi:hypothetical protein
MSVVSKGEGLDPADQGSRHLERVVEEAYIGGGTGFEAPEVFSMHQCRGS